MQKEQQELANLIKGKKVAFIGAGVSHKTLIKEFVELGAHVTLCDQKKSVEDFGDYAATIKELGIDLSLGENYLDGFKGQDIIMRTPGFVGYFEKPLQDAMAAGAMVTSEVELFFQFCPCEIVAVTGSDGKTTTTTLISKFYEAAGRRVHLGGNIGAALLPMLPEVSPDDVAVVELSSFQLISMHQSPNIAVVTNVTPNHLDHHKDMQEYIDAKRNILLYQKQPCRAVLGYENEISRSMQKEQQELANLIKGKKVAFIGAGVSHKTLIREFVELGAHVTLCDQKKSVEDFGDYAATIKELGIDLSLGENYLDGFKGQDIIMRTPGFVGYFEKPLQDAMAAGTMVTSEVELFFQFCPCEIVAVTGSDGKTTTTTLISKFYEAAGRRVHLGGNIGAALLPMLPEVSPDDVAVVELSSFQLISMHQSPNIAVVTNVTPNHLDHHKDMQEYIDAKRNILLYQKQPCRAVLGYENEISRSMQKDCKGKQVWFTRLHETDNGAFLRDDGMLCMAENGVVTPFLAQKDVKLRGLHNIENLLAAAAAVWGEVPVEAIQLVGSNFTGVEHRIEPVRVLDGVTYYNDSIGTSPTRTIAGLRSFDQKVILIAGGYDKHIPYEPLAPEITAHVKNLVLMGATGPRIEKAVREDPNFNEAELPIQHADNMQHAVELARACAKPGDIIILSPASASFDLYPNFEVRGREFKSIVNALK